MDDQTFDLTDEQLAAAADEAWDRANMCLGGGLPDRRAAAFRAVAALARQGWAPAPPAPDHVADSSSSLSREIWDLISESDGVYGLHKNGDLAPWDELLPGGEYELLSSLPPFDDTDSDHIADVSNMVESALDTVYLRALQLTQGAYSQTGGLHGKELEAFRSGIATVECLLKAADAQLRKRQTTFTAFCNSSEFATALRTGGSFNAWPDPYSDCDMTIDVHIPLKLLVKPNHSNQ